MPDFAQFLANWKATFGRPSPAPTQSSYDWDAPPEHSQVGEAAGSLRVRAAGRQRGRDTRALCVPLVHEPLELRVIQIHDIQPDLYHVIHAALAETDPHIGIRVAPVRGRIVVNADHVQDGSCG